MTPVSDEGLWGESMLTPSSGKAKREVSNSEESVCVCVSAVGTTDVFTGIVHRLKRP